MGTPSRAALVAAFAAVYVIWGSTYLAIRFAVEDLPPFLMASARWLMAGAALYAWRRAAGDPAPTARNWYAAAVVGLLLIVGGNGVVSWAEQLVPSNLTALLIAIVPLWVALLGWAWPGGRRPTLRIAGGVVVGVSGVALLVGGSTGGGEGGAHGGAMLVGILAILGASLSWAFGSLWSRKAPLPKSTLQGASMEMLVGGAILLALGLGTGEAARVDLAQVGLRAWLSFGFLVLFGSIVAFSAYVWLLQVTRTELVATYAFVNPVVAVILGWLLAGEAMTPLTWLAAALIVVAIAVIVTAPAPKAPVAAAPGAVAAAPPPKS